MPSAQDGARYFGKGYGLVGKKERCGFSELLELVMSNQATSPRTAQCRILDISASGYYAWLKRPPSARALRNAVLSERIRTIHAESDATYGMPKVRAERVAQGETISRKRVAKPMQRAGLQGISRRRGFVLTTQRDASNPKASDLAQRQFVAQAPKQLWAADITYIPTWVGFIYLAVLIDVWSRRVVGWSIGEYMRTELALAALNTAIAQRPSITAIKAASTLQ